MAKFIIGRKLNMTQVFSESGKVVPVTVIKTGAVSVVQVKKQDGPDGYNAVQVGFGSKRKNNKAEAGHMKKLGNFKKLKEFRVEAESTLAEGDKVDLSQFKVGDFVDVQGISKGRGFAGAMKRHGFRGAPASHGHDHPRAVGSIGSMFPQHVVKGRKMAGRMGGGNVTVKNLEIVEIDQAKNLIAVKGAIPGPNSGLLTIKQAAKKSRVVETQE